MAPAGSKPVEGMGGATVEDFRASLDLKELMNHVMDYTAFEVWHAGGKLGDFTIKLTGQHNVSNAVVPWEWLTPRR